MNESKAVAAINVVDTEYGGPTDPILATHSINPGEPVLLRGTWLEEEYEVHKNGTKIGTLGSTNPRLKTVVDTPVGESLTFEIRQNGQTVKTITRTVESYPDHVTVPSGIDRDLLTQDLAENVHENGPSAGPSPSDIATSHPLIVPADNDKGIAPAPVLRRQGVELGPQGATFRLPNGESVEVGDVEEADEVARYISGENAGNVVESDQDAVDGTGSNSSSTSSSSDLGASGTAAALALAYLIYRRQ